MCPYPHVHVLRIVLYILPNSMHIFGVPKFFGGMSVTHGCDTSTRCCLWAVMYASLSACSTSSTPIEWCIPLCSHAGLCTCACTVRPCMTRPCWVTSQHGCVEKCKNLFLFRSWNCEVVCLYSSVDLKIGDHVSFGFQTRASCKPAAKASKCLFVFFWQFCISTCTSANTVHEYSLNDNKLSI